MAESDAPTAVAVRQLITDRVTDGRSDSSIETELVHSYGSGILLRPPASGVGSVTILRAPPVRADVNRRPVKDQ